METNNNYKVVLEKDGMKFKRLEKNKYNLSYSIENNNIILLSIINFDLIKLIYELNPDIYEKVNLIKNNDNQANITLLMKHFFNDLGIPQKYSHMQITKYISDKKINFIGSSIISEKPSYIPNDVELMQIESLNITCTSITPHKIIFNCAISFHNSITIPPFIEKMIGMIVSKVFNRVKMFIENIKV